MRFRVVVEFTLGTGDEKWKSPPIDTDIEQIVIGGDFLETGDKKLFYFCGAPTSSAVSVEGPLQPEGTTWSWLTSNGLAVTENMGSPLPDGEVKGVQGTAPGPEGDLRVTEGSEWVKIQYTLNGVTWTSPQHDGYTVRKPSLLQRGNTVHAIGTYWDEGAQQFVNHTGYRTIIYYRLRDQFSRNMVAVGVNESFGAFTSNYAGENWPSPIAFGALTDGSAVFIDQLSAFDNGTFNPTPLQPNAPYGTTKIQYGSQKYYGGSITPGHGCQLKEGILQYYLDHADHEG